MGSGFCGNCSAMQSSEFLSDSKDNSTDKMVCPYCRSFRSEVVDHSQRQITMCSQLQSESLSCSSSSTRNVQKMSLNTHHQHYQTHNHSVDKYSQSHRVPLSSGELVGHLPSTNVCLCAKIPTISRYSANSTSRANCYSFSSDGWRAFRLVLLGILVAIPSSMSSPVHHGQRSSSPHHSSGHRSHHSSPHRPMKWVNPCTYTPPTPTHSSEIQMQTPDEEIFQNILVQAKKAENQAREFYEDFREECFGKSGHDYNQLHYDWLGDISEKVDKDLGEPVSAERLEKLEVEDILKSMYRGLQKLAVGLEQVVLDQGIHGGSFYMHFNEAEFQLKYVLCEFQIAMMAKNIQYEDVTREIMDTSFAQLQDRTFRNVRDFSIFRDYINTLEFIRDSFEHFWKQAKRVQS